jgi:uncharacterized protein YjcR
MFPLIVEPEDSVYHESMDDSIFDVIMSRIETFLRDKVLMKSRNLMYQSSQWCINRYRRTQDTLQQHYWRER